ncbi:MAG: phytanoyl-CoA dioxygenase family protein [Spirochaetales bacterium]|nr:phytanoyl-CoA dioxygenase family protein [Spirochaetales bacterium]
MTTHTAGLQDGHVQEYFGNGYTIVPEFFDAEEIALMREVCDRAVADIDRRIDEGDPTVPDINHKNSRYFVPHVHRTVPEIRRVTFGAKMAGVCLRILGERANLFLDQFVVKAAERGMKFSWHQDAGFITHRRVKPYLTCWVPLDDVTLENGTIYVLPYDRAGTRDLIEHVREEGTNDMVGYTGEDPGDPVEVAAGALVAFSSHTLHRSGPNITDAMRRVYLLQYSAELITNPDGSPRHHDTPFLRDGRVVAG